MEKRLFLFIILFIFTLAFFCFVSAGPHDAVVSSDAKIISLNKTSEPILLVQGYLGSPLSWAVMKSRLENEGYLVFTMIVPTFGLGDMTKTSEAVSSKVDEILLQTDAEKVDLIMQSEGGLLGRYYIKNLDGINKIDDYISIGTPNHGTRVAYLGALTVAARQMIPGSQFLRNLNSGDESPGNIHYTSIYSTSDIMMIPKNSPRLHNGATNKIADWGVGHVEMLVDPQIYSWIKESLD